MGLIPPHPTHQIHPYTRATTTRIGLFLLKQMEFYILTCMVSEKSCTNRGNLRPSTICIYLAPSQHTGKICARLASVGGGVLESHVCQTPPYMLNLPSLLKALLEGNQGIPRILTWYQSQSLSLQTTFICLALLTVGLAHLDGRTLANEGL